MDHVVSVNRVPIRLTHERWFHIAENHDDLAGYYDEVLEAVENPDFVMRGHRGSLVAVKNFGPRRYLHVIYRELSSDDGFIITAFFASKAERKKAIWKRQ
jgi:hypothetical protein